jgi:hypothetical protein
LQKETKRNETLAQNDYHSNPVKSTADQNFWQEAHEFVLIFSSILHPKNKSNLDFRLLT